MSKEDLILNQNAEILKLVKEIYEEILKKPADPQPPERERR